MPRYSTEMFFDGATAGGFSKLRAAIAYVMLLGRGGPDLVRARRAQIGFNKLAPAESRLPLPYSMMTASGVKMLEMGCLWRRLPAWS